MKTTTVARGFLGAVASLLGVVAVGCSADGWDEASAGNGEIDSVEQAVTLTPTLPAGLIGIQSCKVIDSGVSPAKTYIVFAGGINIGGTAQSVVDALDTSNDTLVLRASAGQPLNGKTLSVARGFGKTVEDSTGACWVIGGTTAVNNTAASVQSVDKITVNNGTWTVGTVTASGGGTLQLATARNDFNVEPCGASKFLMIGGRTQNTFRNSLELFNPAGPNFTNVTNTLSEAKALFQSAALDSNNDKLMVAGGEDQNGSLSSIDVINVANSCAAASDVTVVRLRDEDSMNNPKDVLNLADTRRGGVAFSRHATTANSFGIAAGASGATLLSSVPLLVIDNWGASATGHFGTALTNINTQTARPELRYVSGVATLIGGADHPVIGSATDSIDEVQQPAWSVSSNGLITKRVGAGVAVSGTTMYAAGGWDAPAVSYETSIEKFTF